MYSIFENCKISISSLKAADNETLTGETLDMQGYDSVIFIAAALKGAALDFTIKAQQGELANLSDVADLAGTSVAFSTAVGTNGLASLEIHQPQERYVRALVAVPDASAATPVSVLAIRFNARDMPQVNAGELHVSPAEGTA